MLLFWSPLPPWSEPEYPLISLSSWHSDDSLPADGKCFWQLKLLTDTFCEECLWTRYLNHVTNVPSLSPRCHKFSRCLIQSIHRGRYLTAVIHPATLLIKKCHCDIYKVCQVENHIPAHWTLIFIFKGLMTHFSVRGFFFYTWWCFYSISALFLFSALNRLLQLWWYFTFVLPLNMSEDEQCYH